MANDQLPADWEAMSYTARVRRAIEIGNQSQSSVAARKLLDDWCNGGFSQRVLAAVACLGSKDVAVLESMTQDPSRLISHRAHALLCEVGTDQAITNALLKLPPRRASKLLIHLRRRRPHVVDQFVTTRATEGDSVAWPLVPLGSETLLEKYIEVAAERGGSKFWRRLAVFFPARAAAEIVDRLNRATSPDGLLFGYARTVIQNLSRRTPELAIVVVEALRAHVPIASIPLQELVARRPEFVADLMIATGEKFAVSFERVVERLGTHRILAIFRMSPIYLGDTSRWLARLPGEQRAELYQELAPAWTTGEGEVGSAIISRLPQHLRSIEARRMVALPVLATRPLQRLPYVGLLPWTEATEQVKPWLGHPEAENRAAALVALGVATRYDRDRLGELLELLSSRKFEQDPVRLAFLNSLASLPSGRWTDSHLPALAKIIRDSLDAGDLSSASVSALGNFIFGLLPFHPEWTVEQLAEVTRERGFPGWVGRDLTASEVRRIAPALTPLAASWMSREHHSHVLGLASRVGRWLSEWPALVALLEKIIIGPSQPYSAASAMALIGLHVRSERDRIITTALAKDESWVVQPTVMNYLNARRQDLLTPFLGQRPYVGRFSTGSVRYVLPFQSGFARWTDAQQELFATSLEQVATAPQTKKDVQVTWDVLFAIKRLAALPGIGPDRLLQFAKDKRPAVQETAVRALGRLDGRQGLPELVEALGDARARWAMYALRQVLNDLPPEQVLSLMLQVPLGKVTVAKEAVRLAGEFGGGSAIAWFTELSRQELHRDVRGALLRALWDHLERPEAWSILDESVASPDPGVVIGLARIQVDRASDAIRERVANLMSRLLEHPEPTVRLAVLTRLASQPVPDLKRELLLALLGKFSSIVVDERLMAVRAALAGATDSDAPAFGRAILNLLPHRRVLASIVLELASVTASFGNRLLRIRTEVLEAIETDRSTIALQVRLAATRFNADAFAHWALKFVGTERWNVATQLIVHDALRERKHSTTDLELAEDVWGRSSDAPARWLALKVLVGVASDQGWTESRRARLDRYREDESPLVADEATLTFPPDAAFSAT